MTAATLVADGTVASGLSHQVESMNPGAEPAT
jgi:hypothetical protein